MLQYNADFLRLSQFQLKFTTCCILIVLFLTIHTSSYAYELNVTEPASTVVLNIPANNKDDVSKVPVDETTVAATESKVSETEQRKPDWDGVLRDTGIVFGGQVAAVGITYLMPESFSAWTPEQKKAGWSKYKENFVHPVMDKDKFYINYALHPYWGATYYTRGRERGLDQTYSLAYSALLSAMYEFGTECIAEKPSIQDLIATPLLGSLLGAYIFEPWRDSIKSKPELRWYDHTVLVLTDPIGVITLGVEKLFGVKSTLVVNVPMPQIQNGSTTTANNYFGASIQFPLN